jgi:hypothetical protein
MDVQEGEVITYERTFTEEEIRAFAELSGDTGQQHVERDAEGRLMAQGLLTATLPTKIGGEVNCLRVKPRGLSVDSRSNRAKR